MTKDEFKQQALLFFYGELSPESEAALRDVMQKSPELQREFDALEVMMQKISAVKPVVSEDLVESSRRELKKSLSSGLLEQHWLARSLDKGSAWLSKFFEERLVPRYALVLGGILVFIFGGASGFMGSMVAQYSVFSPLQKLAKSALNADPFSQQNIKLQNVRILAQDDESGDISFSLDAVTPVTVKGKPSDAQVQKAIIYALTKGANAGVRIQTLGVLKQTDSTLVDENLKQALINAVKFDENAGVRREALQVLKKYRYDESVKETLLHILASDQNPGMRIEAINLLAELTPPESRADEKILSALKQKAADANQYIRVKASELLKGAAGIRD
jgi:hypothetical protein